MESIQKYRKIMRIAGNDETYSAYCENYEESKQAFEAYAASQPEAVREMLQGFVQSSEARNQRLLEIACERMDFPPEETTFQVRKHVVEMYAVGIESDRYDEVLRKYRQARRNYIQASRSLSKPVLHALWRFVKAAEQHQKYFLTIACELMRLPAELPGQED